ncbi:MAG TPA: outer membrane beta-barrel protein [Puia sp.]|nr:outer membrane beta-barrel protein [Puia sp.]
MNRILLSLALMLFIFSSNAQFQKGNILLGGDLSYSGTTSTSPNFSGKTKFNSGNFNISLGKAIRENAVVGINLNFQPVTDTYNTGIGLYTQQTNNYSIGMFYRMYKSLGKDFYFFGEGGGGYNGSTTSTKDSTGHEISTGSGNGGHLYITPGLAYKISNKFFIELSIPEIFILQYTDANTKMGSVTTETDKTLSAGLNLNANILSNVGLGFRLVL